MSGQKSDSFENAKGCTLRTLRYLEMYYGNLFRRTKNDFGERSTLFSTQFYDEPIWVILIRVSVSFV